MASAAARGDTVAASDPFPLGPTPAVSANSAMVSAQTVAEKVSCLLILELSKRDRGGALAPRI